MVRQGRNLKATDKIGGNIEHGAVPLYRALVDFLLLELSRISC